MLNAFLYHDLATTISLIYFEIHYLHLPIFYLICVLTHLKFIEKASFKGKTWHIYCKYQWHITKMEILYYTYLLIKCLLDQSNICQILSVRDEYTFHFSNFLIIGLCSSLATCWFGIILLCNSTPRRLFIKKFINHWTNSMLIFWIFRNIKCFVTW